MYGQAHTPEVVPAVRRPFRRDTGRNAARSGGQRLRVHFVRKPGHRVAQRATGGSLATRPRRAPGGSTESVGSVGARIVHTGIRSPLIQVRWRARLAFTTSVYDRFNSRLMQA